MDYNLFGTVKRIWAFGKCAIEINYLLLLFIIDAYEFYRTHWPSGPEEFFKLAIYLPV